MTEDAGAEAPTLSPFPEEEVAPGDIESSLGSPSDDDHDAHDARDAFATYQTAKQRYCEARNSRGHSGPPAHASGGDKRGRLESLFNQAKKNSFCSLCGARGHWRRDPECPNAQAHGEEVARCHLDGGLPGDP
eukprot:15434522-Alexandrium_andersonii.AAC.1